MRIIGQTFEIRIFLALLITTKFHVAESNRLQRLKFQNINSKLLLTNTRKRAALNQIGQTPVNAHL